MRTTLCILWCLWSLAVTVGAEPASADLGRAIRVRAFACLGCDAEGRVGGVQLIPLNTPSIPSALPRNLVTPTPPVAPLRGAECENPCGAAAPRGRGTLNAGWSWTETVVSSLDSNTPRVQLSLLGPTGQHFNWTLAFRKKSLIQRVVLQGPCSKGTEIGSGQYKLDPVWIDAGQANLTYLDQIPTRRQRARRNLDKATPLRPLDLEDVPDQESGASLVLVSSSDGVTLSLPAVALESGYLGKPFRVRLLSSGKTATAWVWAPGEVRDTPPRP